MVLIVISFLAKPRGSIPGALLIAAIFLFYLVVTFAFYKSPETFGITVVPGLAICRSDCSDYDNLSDYIREHRRFYPVGDDFHTSIQYRGFTLYVAVVKGVFKGSWDVAYVVINGLLMAGLALFSARAFARGSDYRFTFLFTVILLAVNLQLLIYGKTLLTDHMFAVAIGITSVLLAAGVGQENRRYLIAALAMSLVILFLRPSGTGVVVMSGAVVLAYVVFGRHRLVMVTMAPPLVGLTFWVLSATITAYGVDRVDDVSIDHMPDPWPSSVKASMQQLLRFNYFGDTGLDHDNRLGAMIVNFPYQSWSINDGTPLSITGSFLKRIPRIFEIGMPGFSTKHNVYRYGFYTAIFILFLGYALNAIRLRNRAPEHLLLVSLLIGYVMVLASTSHITLRFRLPIEVLLILGSANIIAYLMRGSAYLTRDRALMVSEPRLESGFQDNREG